jgi:hypothetical protein
VDVSALHRDVVAALTGEIGVVAPESYVPARTAAQAAAASGR